MDFIGRTTELSTLEKEYSKNSSFVVIYGRRRVGKTTLIKQFLKNKNSFYFLATREIESQSMKRFAGIIARETGNPMLNKISFNDWVDLFRLIADNKPAEKKVLVIDEFPYLVKTNPAFPSIVQNVWDEFLKDSNIMFILCGSLLSMMKKHTLDYDSPLYGRRTAQIRLMPLPFMDVYAQQNLSFENAVMQYCVTGGVPKYMEFFDEQNISLMEQIQENVLSKNGFLYEEPKFLLNEEVQVPANYFSIIKTIADGNHKLGSIAGILNLAGSALTPYMTTLIELGFIEKQVPVTEKNPVKSRKGLYFISDNFIRFWFRYVYPYQGELELDNVQIVLDEMQKDFIKNFVAFSYENICQNIFAELCKSGQLKFVPSKIGSYWRNDFNGDTQIDIMAVDNTNKAVFCGECKYHILPVDADVYFDLRKKVENSVELQKTFPNYQFIYGVFSKSGFTGRLLDLNFNNRELFLINEDQIL
jgi:hypothetical protein